MSKTKTNIAQTFMQPALMSD